ncbi:hypothetical protein OSTOST_11897 [Ostertagia ostertagi]
MQSSSHLKKSSECFFGFLNVCMDFFLAGMETTSTTLRWSTLLLAAHPDVQRNQELQRCANIVPVNLTHRAVRDTSVGSEKIPADTFIIGDIHYIMAHSPKTVEQLCPFSVGKRQCAGEALARVELFIGLVTLLQNYKIEPSKGRTIDLQPKSDGVIVPKEQPLRLTPVAQ